jgi:dual oxidase
MKSNTRRSTASTTIVLCPSGAADRHLIRVSPVAYQDGVGEPSGFDRPNPRDISLAVMQGAPGKGSSLNRTAFLVHFGQQVVEELLDVQRPGCIVEYANIPIAKDDPLYGGIYSGFIPLTRSRYDFTTGQSPGNPRQQINEITPWIDGTLMYGPNKAWCDTLRSFSGGRLAEGAKGFPPDNDIGLPIANPPVPVLHKILPAHRFYRLGNPRTNENPMLLAMALIWFRNHNYHADRLAKLHPTWDDEKLFMEARKWTVAEHQVRCVVCVNGVVVVVDSLGYLFIDLHIDCW